MAGTIFSLVVWRLEIGVRPTALSTPENVKSWAAFQVIYYAAFWIAAARDLLELRVGEGDQLRARRGGRPGRSA
jgi:hypothetical protein